MKCEVCGCTDEWACDGGCEWASCEPPICSNCFDGPPLYDVRYRSLMRETRPASLAEIVAGGAAAATYCVNLRYLAEEPPMVPTRWVDEDGSEWVVVVTRDGYGVTFAHDEVLP